LNLKNKKCVIVGGGEVALRKVNILLNAGAKVVVISPQVVPELKALADKGKIGYILREYKKGDLDGATIVIATTNHKEVNEKIVKESREKGIWINVADDPELCDFILPAIVCRDSLLIAISTSGKSPSLAKKIREELEEQFGDEYAIFLDLMEKLREKRLKEKKGLKENRQWFTNLVNSPILDMIKRGEMEKVNIFLKENLGDKYSLENIGFSFNKRIK